MLRFALFFLVVSLIAALFGFGGISAAAADIARILFFVAIVIFLVLLVAGLMAGSPLFGSRGALHQHASLARAGGGPAIPQATLPEWWAGTRCVSRLAVQGARRRL